MRTQSADSPLTKWATRALEANLNLHKATTLFARFCWRKEAVASDANVPSFNGKIWSIHVSINTTIWHFI